MCLIIASQKGDIPDKQDVKWAQHHNGDGFGITFLDGGRLRTMYNLIEGADLYPYFEMAQGKPYVAHFRWATHGGVTVDNAHPFVVLKGRLVVAHNGVIHEEATTWKMTDKTKSDTWHFVQQQLKPRAMNCVRPDMVKKLGTKIGKGNKLAFLDYTGKVTIVNESEGQWLSDIWVSNLYSLQEPWVWSKDTVHGTEMEGHPDRFEYDVDVDCELCFSPTRILTDVDGTMCCDTCATEWAEELEALAQQDSEESGVVWHGKPDERGTYSFDKFEQRKSIDHTSNRMYWNGHLNN